MADHPPPIDALLTIGEFDPSDGPCDYAAMGLGPEHLPDLIRLARDLGIDPETKHDDPRIWGPVHAWWALGQVGDEAAIEPLIDLMTFVEERDGEWMEDLPKILARIGPSAIAPLSQALADETKMEWVRIGISSALEQLPEEFPDARDRCVEVLTHQLSMNDPRSDSLNGFLVSGLMTLEAVESASTIERAFEADCVDTTIAGDWPVVRFRLGLGPEPERARPVWSNPPRLPSDPSYRKSRPDPKRLMKRKAQKDAREKQQGRSKKRKQR